MDTVLVEYVGKKKIAFDNVAQTGKCWHGQGHVQEVTVDQAKALLQYPDQWALVDVDDAEDVAEDEPIEVIDENGEKVAILPSDLKKPLEKMTKPQLIAYAKETWDKALDTSLPKKQMIDQIEEWVRDLGV